MAKITTEKTRGGAQQYTRGGGEGEESKMKIALDARKKGTSIAREILAAQMDRDLKKEFIKKYGITPNKAEAMMGAAFAGAGKYGSGNLEKFYQDRVDKEPKVKNKLDNKKLKDSMADYPGKGSDEPITKRNKGGLIKTGVKDYRKGGMFY